MPWNLTRYYGAGDLHFITCSCYRWQPLLGTARRRDLFLAVLEQVRRRYQFVVVGYVAGGPSKLRLGGAFGVHRHSISLD